MGRSHSEEGECWMGLPNGMLYGVFWIQQGTLWPRVLVMGSCRGCPIHGAAQDLLKDHRIGCVSRRTPLAPSHIMARLAKWYYDAPSSDDFVFHLGHGPVFIAEVVNVMAPHSLGFGVKSIN